MCSMQQLCRASKVWHATYRFLRPTGIKIVIISNYLNIKLKYVLIAILALWHVFCYMTLNRQVGFLGVRRPVIRTGIPFSLTGNR